MNYSFGFKEKQKGEANKAYEQHICTNIIVYTTKGFIRKSSSKAKLITELMFDVNAEKDSIPNLNKAFDIQSFLFLYRLKTIFK